MRHTELRIVDFGLRIESIVDWRVGKSIVSGSQTGTDHKGTKNTTLREGTSKKAATTKSKPEAKRPFRLFTLAFFVLLVSLSLW